MTDKTDKLEAEIDRSRHALNDTIEALGGKLTPGQIVDEAMGLLQGQAGQLSANFGRQVRDNPLPLLLIAAGAALLFTSKAKASSESTSVEEREDGQQFRKLEAARSGLVRDPHDDDTTWANRLHEVEATALGAQQRAGEATEAFKERVKAAGEALGKTISSAGDRIGAGYARASHAITERASGARDYVAAKAHDAKLAAGNVTRKAHEMYDDNPLAASAIGVALGALIGSVAPLSSIERDKLQGLANAAARKGAKLAEGGVRAAKDVAGKAVDALN